MDIYEDDAQGTCECGFEGQLFTRWVRIYLLGRYKETLCEDCWISAFSDGVEIDE